MPTQPHHRALSTAEGLASFWTTDSHAEPQAGSVTGLDSAGQNSRCGSTGSTLAAGSRGPASISHFVIVSMLAYDRGMRYAQRGGYTPAEQQRRERLRLEAAERFARGDTISEIARDLRVTEGSVRRWHRAWREGGTAALRSKGPVSREKLSPQQWARLEAELRKGPLAHGFAGDQR